MSAKDFKKDSYAAREALLRMRSNLLRAADYDTAAIEVETRLAEAYRLIDEAVADGLEVLRIYSTRSGEIPCSMCNEMFPREELLAGDGSFIGWCISCDEGPAGRRRRRRSQY